MRPYKDIPWLINHNIKSEMRERKKLYDLAKASQNPNDWHLYRKTRNNVSSLLKSAHHNYIVAIYSMILIQIIANVFGLLLKGFAGTIQEYHL